MRFLSQLARQASRLLSAQARRLHANLERLAVQVREAVARTVSQTVAEATHEALQLVLEGPPTMSGAWQPTPEGFRRSWDTDNNNDQRGWPSYPPRTRYGSPGEEHDWEEDDAEESPGRDAGESASLVASVGGGLPGRGVVAASSSGPLVRSDGDRDRRSCRPGGFPGQPAAGERGHRGRYGPWRSRPGRRGTFGRRSSRDLEVAPRSRP